VKKVTDVTTVDEEMKMRLWAEGLSLLVLLSLSLSCTLIIISTSTLIIIMFTTTNLCSTSSADSKLAPPVM
jgi:hypothetical protein